MNTDCSNKKGTYWWRKSFYLTALDLKDLKNLILQDDRKILNKILFGIEKLKKKIARSR